MKNSLSKLKLERYSRQIIIKDIVLLGQKKIINSKVLIVGIGGLGSPVADLLARCGVGYIGAIDHDKVYFIVINSTYIPYTASSQQICNWTT